MQNLLKGAAALSKWYWDRQSQPTWFFGPRLTETVASSGDIVCGENTFTADNRHLIRSELLEDGVAVYSHPSTGGIIVKWMPDEVELEFLGIEWPHLDFRPEDDQEEQDFGRRLRMVGGNWWPSWDEWAARPLEERKADSNKEINIYGWPDKGTVFVQSYQNIKEADQLLEKLSQVGNMEDRCTILRDVGAVFYAKAEDCPLLREVYQT